MKRIVALILGGALVWLTALGIGELLLRSATERATVESSHDTTGSDELLPHEQLLRYPKYSAALETLWDEPAWEHFALEMTFQSFADWDPAELARVRTALTKHSESVMAIDSLANGTFVPGDMAPSDASETYRSSPFYAHVSSLALLRAYDNDRKQAESLILLLYTIVGRDAETVRVFGGWRGLASANRTACSYLSQCVPTGGFTTSLRHAAERIPDALPNFGRDIGDEIAVNAIVVDVSGGLSKTPKSLLQALYDSPIALPVRKIEGAIVVGQITSFADRVQAEPRNAWVVARNLEPAVLDGPKIKVYKAGTRAFCNAALETQARKNLVLTALAMEEYRANNDQYPESFDYLDRQVIEAIAYDPFSDKSLLYDPSVPILYSRGKNSVDDGGKEDDIDWWGFQSKPSKEMK